MQQVKRFISLLLVLVLCMATTIPVFASDAGHDFSEIKKHSFEITIEPCESIGNVSGISPYIWDQKDFFFNNVCYTTFFYVPDQYFGFEVIAGNEFSQPCNIPFIVQLVTPYDSVIISLNAIAHGGTYKLDWISVTPNSNYRFKIINNTSARLHIIITYYSW